MSNARGWMLHREHSLLGFVAVGEEDTPLALADLRWFARPDHGDIAPALDDLFTDPEARGSGAAARTPVSRQLHIPHQKPATDRSRPQA